MTEKDPNRNKEKGFANPFLGNPILSSLSPSNPYQLDITAHFQGHPSGIWLGACRFQDQSGDKICSFPLTFCSGLHSCWHFATK